MRVPEAKRFEYWNHFVEQWVIDKTGGGHGVTGPRLLKIRELIWNDEEFWDDIVLRHGGLNQTPEQMKMCHSSIYEHCLSNFWGMIYQDLLSERLIKL